MKTFAEKLAKELLHTPRREWVRLIGKRAFEAVGSVVCSYCGHKTEAAGRSKEEMDLALLEHILVCEKRPELKMLDICLKAAEAVDAFPSDWNASDEKLDAYVDRMAELAVVLDKLKVKQEEAK